MAHEVEVAAADAATGWFRWRRKHAQPPGGLCANCGTVLQGPWCHNCGQLGENFHRSIGHLVAEAFEGFFHADGRLWRTLPRLVVEPGRLTRDYLDGKRAPQIPPLRLFLVVVLVFFFAGSATNQVRTVDHGRGVMVPGIVQVRAGPAPPGLRLAPTSGLGEWLRPRAEAALRNPERFRAALEQWSERAAFMLLPISALLLSLLFVFQRRFYVFDHLIFSMHSLSFLGLLLVVYLLLKNAIGGAANWVLLAAPVHLFVHMRGVYGTSIPGTLIRMALLFIGSLIGFAALMVGLVMVALSAMGAPS